ncbi:unnamed protein product [Rhodiola kirilowii]
MTWTFSRANIRAWKSRLLVFHQLINIPLHSPSIHLLTSLAFEFKRQVRTRNQSPLNLRPPAHRGLASVANLCCWSPVP